jgi:hypothetical protein
MKIAKNPIFHAQTNHIEAHNPFIRKNKISREKMFTHVASNDQLADIFTKPLGKTKFQRLREKLGVCDLKWVQHICEL